jgi:hypothetical protein
LQLAFVSFTEFTNAGRCFLPIESQNGGYVRSRVFSGLEQVSLVNFWVKEGSENGSLGYVSSRVFSGLEQVSLVKEGSENGSLGYVRSRVFSGLEQVSQINV